MQASLREEAEKRGLGSGIDIKLCRLEKGPDGNKAYAINTQAQWNEERPMFSNRGMVLQGSSYCNTYRSYRHCINVTQHVFHLGTVKPRLSGHLGNLVFSPDNRKYEYQ